MVTQQYGVFDICNIGSFERFQIKLYVDFYEKFL